MTVRLESKRIHLRDFRQDDVPVYVHWNAPGHAWQFLDGPYMPKPSESEVQAMGDRLQARIDDGNWPDPRMRLVIADASTDSMLGFVSSYWESEETNWLLIGIVIFEDANWASGIGTAAMTLWIDYLFAHRPELVRLDLRTWSGNTGMMRLAEKLGFQQEACFRKARIVDGDYYDGLGYGILREEWNH